jgi:glutamate racemase
MNSHSSIAIFDSGFGGLTVMKAIRDLLPFENIIYFGDTARVPYGTKSEETILRYSMEIATYLTSLDIKILVVACHTASCISLSILQGMFKIPVIGVVDPSVEKIIASTSEGKIAILGTRATVSSGLYQSMLQNKLPHADITAIACPLFVSLVEEGYINHPLTEMTVQEYLKPLKQKKVDTLLLGSTHFPLLKAVIQNEVGEDVTLIDPGLATALALKETLSRLEILNSSTDAPHYQFIVSDNPDKFRLLGQSFLNYPIEDVSQKLVT